MSEEKTNLAETQVETAKPEGEAKETNEEEFSWADLTFDDEDDNKSTADDADNGSGGQDKGDEKEYWQIAAEKAGIEAKDESEFIEKVKKPQVKEVYVDEKDPAIRKMKGYANMKDEDLVREDKKAKGWSDDKIERYLDKNKDNVEFEAEDIRSQLKQSINIRQSEIDGEAQNRQKTQTEAVQNLHKNVKEKLSKTEEVFGFRVGKDETATGKWQKGMEKYITSGSVFKDIDKAVKDAQEGKPETLIEIAQFLKGRDGIVKGLMQKGKSQEAQKFISDLENSKGEDTTKGERAYAKEKSVDNLKGVLG